MLLITVSKQIITQASASDVIKSTNKSDLAPTQMFQPLSGPWRDLCHVTPPTSLCIRPRTGKENLFRKPLLYTILIYFRFTYF